MDTNVNFYKRTKVSNVAHGSFVFNEHNNQLKQLKQLSYIEF